MTLNFDPMTLKVMVCRENSAEVTTTARAAAAAALLCGGASSPAMMMGGAESTADCVSAAAAAAFRHQLLAATAVVAAKTPSYIGAPAADHRLPTSPSSSTSPLSSIDHLAASPPDSADYDSAARLKQQLAAGKDFLAL